MDFLEDCCQWLNVVDGILTAQALTKSPHVLEINLFMSRLWTASPALYGVAKFWIFWLGLRILHRSTCKEPAKVRRHILLAIGVTFMTINIWHAYIYRLM